MVCHGPRSSNSSNNKRDPIGPRPPTFKKKSSSSSGTHERHSSSHPELLYHCCHSTNFPMSICMREHNEDHISATHPMNAFTDGSYIHSKLDKHRAGYAVFLQDRHDYQQLAKNVRADSKISYTLNRSLPEFHIDLSTHKLSSMIVELLAILEAIVHVQEWWEKPSIYVYTDSLASLQLLWRFRENRENLWRHALKEFLAAIHCAAANSRVQVHLLKVKAHASIHGNEAADRLAYAAANARLPHGGFDRCPEPWSFYPEKAGDYSPGARDSAPAIEALTGSAPGFVSAVDDESKQRTPPEKRSASYSSPGKAATRRSPAKDPASFQRMLRSMTRALQEGSSSPETTPGKAPGDIASCVQELFHTVASVDSARNQAAAGNNRRRTRSNPRVPPQQEKNDVEPIIIIDDDDEFIFISDDEGGDADGDDDPVFISENGKFVEYIVLDDDDEVSTVS